MTRRNIETKIERNIITNIRVFLIIKLKDIKFREGIIYYLSSYLFHNFSQTLTTIIIFLFFLT